VPPELGSKRPDAAYVPYNLVDRVLAAAGEGSERDDVSVQEKVRALREAVGRWTQGLKRIEGR
jgi:nuclear pore complex protein Nup160